MIISGGEGQRRGDARWCGRDATPQPEHMPFRSCPGFAKTPDGKTPGNVIKEREYCKTIFPDFEYCKKLSFRIVVISTTGDIDGF
jgi:hypothetical protein